MRRSWAVMVVVLPVGALAGCVSNGAPPDGAATPSSFAPQTVGPVTLLEDPAGDASHRPTLLFTGGPVSVQPCQSPGPTPVPLPELSDETCDQAVAIASSARPAAPEADITALRVSVEPSQLLVELEVAGLEASLDRLRRDMPDGSMVEYYICLHSLVSGCHDDVRDNGVFRRASGSEGAIAHQVFVSARFRQGALHLRAEHYVVGGPCLTNWCGGDIPLALIEGEPGLFRAAVPRGLMPGLEAATVIRDAHVAVRQVTFNVWADEALLRTYLFAGASAGGTGAGATTIIIEGESLDETDAPLVASFPLSVESMPRAMMQHVSRVEDASDDQTLLGWGPDDPPAPDLVATSIIESPETLTLSMEFVALEEEYPGYEIDYWLELYFQDGPYLYAETYIYPDGVDSSAWAKMCPEDECWIALDAAPELTAGSPGWYNITIPRSALGDLPAGTPVGLLYGYADLYTLGTYEQAGPAVVGGQVGLRDAFDDTDGGRAVYWLAHDTAAVGGPAVPASVLIPDDPSDFDLPPLFDSAAPYDIVYVEARALAQGRSQFGLGVADLAGRAVPPTYDAIVYAFGVQTAAGDFMLGYYEGQGDGVPPGGFFCGPDTLFFREMPTNPTAEVLTPVEGKQVAASRSGRPSGGGALLVTAPTADCLAAEDSDLLEFDALSAGTFVIRNPTGAAGEGEVTPLDRTEASGPIVLAPDEPLAVASIGTPWYQDPQWWLLGLGAVLVVAEAGVLVGKRRRTVAAAVEDRLVAYRRVVEREITHGTPAGELTQRLEPLRAVLGVSDTEHARIEAELRTLYAGVLGAGRGLVPGERFLDRYDVVAALAAGGGGRTYRCRDARLGRDVVLKVLQIPGDERGIERVLHEARAFAAVKHERVVTLYDVERVGNEVFLVLENVEGGSVKERLAQGPLERDEMTRLADDLLSALGAVHAAGIVHRDVKPANVLVTHDGHYKLADFGIAHLPGVEATIAGLGRDSAVGTLRYMSPEQARGERVDARSDLYSAALTLYEAWTGLPYLRPREGESVAEIQVRAAAGAGTVDATFARSRVGGFFARALARDPEARFPDAERMRVALLDAVRGAEADVPRTGSPSR